MNGELFLDTPKVSFYSFWLFVYVLIYLTNIIYMYMNHFMVRLTFGALLTLGVWVNAKLL